MRSAVVAAIFGLMAGGAEAQPVLRLKGRISPSRPTLNRPASRAGTHYILQFHTYPDIVLRRELARRGIRILEYVPDNALLVSGQADGIGGLDLARLSPVLSTDKISPLLDQLSSGPLLVELYPDADLSRARVAIAEAGFQAIDNPGLLPQQLVVTGPYSRLAELAELDDVKYLLPATAELAAGEIMVGCAGALTEAGAIGDYVLVGRGWPKDAAGNVDLKYFIQSLTDKLDPSLARAEVERALREWTRYTKLTISPGTQQSAERSIDILFGRGPHGDTYPFDGIGGVLAHTFYPSPPNPEPVAGDTHLDADESWQVGSPVDLYSVVLHEAGHALGLGHSDRPGSVMYPYYKLATSLAADDIAAIQALYGTAGPATTPPPPPTPTPTPTPTPAPTPTPKPGGADTSAPSMSIVSPSLTVLSTTVATVTISGTAADNVGVTSVKWTNSTGSSGLAGGTTSWSASIPLLFGTNAITIRAYDAAGNSAWRAITVVRR